MNFFHRFSINSKVSKFLFLALKMLIKYPSFFLSRIVFMHSIKKYFLGSKNSSFYNIQSICWKYFINNDASEFIKIGDFEFYNDDALIAEYGDIFLSDLSFDFSIYSIERKIAATFLIFLSDEGPYQFNEIKINNGDIVVDAGSNMGIFSLFSSKKASLVYAFEPGIEAQNILNKNILRNDCTDKIKIMNSGLSNINGEVNLNLTPVFGHVSSSIMSIDSKNSVSYKIEVVTLDSWALKNNISKIDFIKADIEGAERLLLQGATSILKEFSPKLAICTYHSPEDPVLLETIILKANPNYKIYHTSHKLYAYV